LRVGDGLFVTGCVGAAALARLRAERSGGQIRHLPVPRLQAGRRLLGLAGHGACIDLSDGLLSDLDRLLEIDHLGAELKSECLPMPRGFAPRCRELGLDPMKLALSGGEDYELLFSLRPPCMRRMTSLDLRRRLGVEVTRIGTVSAEPGVRGVPTSGFFAHY
jgi:thiamine-monophosphate kinase